jgi:hypothetical protein
MRTGLGFGGLALTACFADDRPTADPVEGKTPRATGTAQRVIHIFLEGGPSQVDTFDPKTELSDRDSRPVPVPGQQPEATAFGSPFRFAKHGQSGLEISELFSHLAKRADDLCVIRSMHTDEPGHEGALLLMNCGSARVARPSVGAWVTYGLGLANQNMPGFVVLYDQGMPIKGAENWQAAFLPGVHQGTAIDIQHQDVAKLLPYIQSPVASAAEQGEQLALLRELNSRHAADRIEDSRLEGRIRSFEMAYRMQVEAGDAFDVRREPKHVRDLYGDSPAGRQLLIARRLVERGVRFIQAYHSGWDHHDNLADQLKERASAIDQALGGLLTDLSQRDLLKDTLVVCCGEFGRTPTRDGNSTGIGKPPGRDHNPNGFSCWLAGGGVKGGLAYGATDELGFAAVQDKVHVHDLHATILHLLGFDHQRLTFRYAGRDFRLTDTSGKVVDAILCNPT